MGKRIFLFVVIVILLVAVLPVHVTAQEGNEPVRTGLRPDAPPYGVRGPYWVGFADHHIEDNFERPLDAFIWYPAVNPDGVEEQIDYTLPWWGGLTMSGHALEGAAPDFEGGPYPLVIFSHSANGHRLIGHYLSEHLASHGFVVMAIDYQDNERSPGQPPNAHFISRPKDVSRQIDYAEKLSADGVWEGLIDVEHVGVTGHSAGGLTALAAAGGRYDWDHLAEVCETDPDPFGTCREVLPYIERTAKIAGWDDVPASPWPSFGDDRVDAVAPLAPGARFLGPAGVQDIAVPVMLLGGTHDTIAVPESNFYSVFDALNAPKTQVLFENGDHLLFYNSCADEPYLVEAGLFWLCSDPVWDMARAHDLTDHFVTAFFLAELYGDEEAAAALAPETVQFPGITYETTGY